MINSRIFKRYLFSYLLVLFIPITIISFYIYSQFIQQFREAIMQSTTRILAQTRDTTDKHLESFANIASHASQNQHISFLMGHDHVNLVSGYPYLINAMKELNQYKNANSVIENIFIFFRSGDTVLSDTSKYDFPMFLEYFQWQELPSEEFKQLITTVDSETILPSQGTIFGGRRNNVISYMQPLPMNDFSPKAVLLLTIDEDSIKQSMERSLAEYEGYVCVLDGSNHTIFSNKLGDFDFDNEKRDQLLSELESQTEDDYYTIRHDFVISSVKSPKNGWKYISFIPVNNILAEVNDINVRMIEILALALLVGLAIVSYFSRESYKGLQGIMNAIRVYENNKAPVNNYKSEWSLINDTIVNYVSKNESLQQKIYRQIPMMKNTFFRQLLKGSFTDEKSVDEMTDFLGMDIRKRQYGVFIVEIDNSGIGVNNAVQNEAPIKKLILATITNAVEQIIRQDCFVYALEEDDIYRVNVVVGMDDVMEKEQYLVKMSESIKEFIKANLGFTVTIGVGGGYSSLYMLKESYNEANKALEYKMIMGRNVVISYDAISNRGVNKICYSFKQEKELINFLRMGEYKEIQMMLDEIVRILKSEPVTISVIKYIYFDIINTAMKAAEEINIESADIELFIAKLTNMQTMDEIYHAVSEFYNALCIEIQDLKKSKNLELRDRVIDYVQKNYYDSMLSVDGIADYFSVSPSYLSRFMKDHLGYPITDYIHEIRLVKAKELLQTTDKTVAVIAGEVGYNSLHNFSRVFKRYERITPTDFRIMSNPSNLV